MNATGWLLPATTQITRFSCLVFLCAVLFGLAMRSVAGAAYVQGATKKLQGAAIITQEGTIVFNTPIFRIMGSQTTNPGKDMSNPFPNFNPTTNDFDPTITDPVQVADGDSPANAIRWDTREIHVKNDFIDGITYNKTTWLRAKTYLEIDASITAGNGGLQIYTDNTNALNDASFTEVYQGNYKPAERGIIDPVGLYPTKQIQQLDGTVLRNGASLSLAWRITTASTSTLLNIQQGAISFGNFFPTRLWADTIASYIKYNPTSGVPSMVTKTITGLGSEFPCFIYMKDLRSPDNIKRAVKAKLGLLFDITNDNAATYLTTANINALTIDDLCGALEDYSKIKHPELGIQIGENTWAQVTGKNYIFFAADFRHGVGKNADGTGNTQNYKAKIMLEAFSE